MYQAFNKRVIAIPLEASNTTESGIIINKPNNACVAYKVCFTNELTNALQDKVIYAEARYKNFQLVDNGPNGETYVVIPVDDILAVKA